jgi:hypothetical protein
MARAHCVFVQAQDLPWREGLPGGIRPGVDSRTLSLDPADGAGSYLVRYPAGWRRGGLEHLTVAEELLVLEGALTINGECYGKGHYAYLPAGYMRLETFAPAGAVVLTLLSGPAVPRAGAAAGGYDGRLLVVHRDSNAIPWTDEGVDPRFDRIPKMKRLRTDPYTRETSFLFTIPTKRLLIGGAPRPQLTHPMIEEIFCLEGDYVWGDAGHMGPGGYAWWREGEHHGPNGTHLGFVLFVRTVGGPLENLWNGPPRTIDTEYPPYRPRLPQGLAVSAKPWDRVTTRPY